MFKKIKQAQPTSNEYDNRLYQLYSAMASTACLVRSYTEDFIITEGAYRIYTRFGPNDTAETELNKVWTKLFDAIAEYEEARAVYNDYLVTNKSFLDARAQYRENTTTGFNLVSGAYSIFHNNKH